MLSVLFYCQVNVVERAPTYLNFITQKNVKNKVKS
jgi:hypothetical protein